MRILTIGELTPEHDASVAALDASTVDPPHDIAHHRISRSLGAPWAEYVGAYAVEGKDVLSRVSVLRGVLTTGRGDVEFSGITDVVTRPDALRRKLAERLFREVHRRERARGMRWAMLWTQPSWGAHRLYERLRYSDVYSPPFAVRRGLSRRPGGRSTRCKVRNAEPRDAGTLTALLRRAARGRLGFVHHPGNPFRLRFQMGWRLPRDHRILERDGRPVGYFHSRFDDRHLVVNEAVVISADYQGDLLDAVEQLAARRWLIVSRTTFVADAGPELERREYRTYPSSHLTFMVRPFPGVAKGELAAVRDTFTDPGFFCQAGDVF